MRTFISVLVCIIGLGGVAQAGTFDGTFWDADASFSGVEAAITYANATAPTATFDSTVIDYPRAGGSIGDATTLAAFLGPDGTSLRGGGDVSLDQSVFLWIGQIDLSAGTHTFSVASDDGFRLVVGDQVMEFSGPRAFGITTQTFTLAGGPTDVTLWFYENAGKTGVEFRIDGKLATATPAAVPLPATAFLSMVGMGALTILRRKRRL